MHDIQSKIVYTQNDSGLGLLSLVSYLEILV